MDKIISILYKNNKFVVKVFFFFLIFFGNKFLQRNLRHDAKNIENHWNTLFYNLYKSKKCQHNLYTTKPIIKRVVLVYRPF